MCTHPLQPGCPRVRRVVGPIDQAAQLLLKSDDIRRQLRDPATWRSKCSRLCLRNARSHQSCFVAVHQTRGDEERMSTLVQTAATRCCICHAKPAQSAWPWLEVLPASTRRPPRLWRRCSAAAPGSGTAGARWVRGRRRRRRRSARTAPARRSCRQRPAGALKSSCLLAPSSDDCASLQLSSSSMSSCLSAMLESTSQP